LPSLGSISLIALLYSLPLCLLRPPNSNKVQDATVG
jgi:hypothetical protein